MHYSLHHDHWPRLSCWYVVPCVSKISMMNNNVFVLKLLFGQIKFSLLPMNSVSLFPMHSVSLLPMHSLSLLPMHSLSLLPIHSLALMKEKHFLFSLWKRFHTIDLDQTVNMRWKVFYLQNPCVEIWVFSHQGRNEFVKKEKIWEEIIIGRNLIPLVIAQAGPTANWKVGVFPQK